MNEFESILGETLKYEGGYSNDPYDTGGETFKGISRKHHPNWGGWNIIDSLKMNGIFNESILDSSSQYSLEQSVKSFYQMFFWDPLCCSDMAPKIARCVFDTAVNLGRHKAILFLQQGLNLLNRNKTIYSDLVEDGVIGPKTLFNIKILQNYGADEINNLLKIMNILRGVHYINFMKKSPIQEKFARGWLKRVSL